METRNGMFRVYRVLRGGNGASGHARLQRQGARAAASLYARGLPASAPVRVLVSGESGAREWHQARTDAHGAVHIEPDPICWAREPTASLFVVSADGEILLEGFDQRLGAPEQTRDRASALSLRRERREEIMPPPVQADTPAPKREEAPPAFCPLPFSATAQPAPLPRGVRIPALERPRGLALDPADCRRIAMDGRANQRPCDLPPPVRWPQAALPLRAYFQALPLCRPILDAGWRFVRVPLPSGQGDFFVGVRQERGAIRAIQYLVPGEEDEAPPTALAGYRFVRGEDGRGYWRLRQRITQE